MNRLLKKVAGTLFILSAVVYGGTTLAQDKPSEIKIGITLFSSGPASVFGDPAQAAAEIFIEDINNSGGIAGVPVRAYFVDEGAGGEHLLSEYRRLAQEVKVDVMFASISSGSCNKIVPLAEDLKVLNLMWDCGTQKIFEENSYRYAFRTQANATPEMLSTLLYLLKTKPDFKSIAVVNQDYSWGRDSWHVFSTALKRLKPDVKVVAELFPKFGTPDFSTEISRLLSLRPDVILSTSWGGDLDNFVKQSMQRGLLARSTFVLPLLESSLQRIPNLPAGVIAGGRGDHYFLHPERLDDPSYTSFVSRFKQKTGDYPIYPAFHMSQAFAALEKAYKTALIKNKGRWPSKEELVDAMEGLHFRGLGREVRIRADHQGLEDQMISTTARDPKYNFAILDNMMLFPAEKITTPVGMKSIDWLKQLPSNIVDIPVSVYKHNK